MESVPAQERAVPMYATVAVGALILIAGAARSDLAQKLDGEGAALALAFAALVLGLAKLAVRRWRVRPAVAAALVAAAFYVPMLGPAAVAVVALMTAAAVAIGSALVPRDAPARPWLALALGFGVAAGVAGWLLPFRVHYAPLYALAALACVVVRRAEVLAAGRAALAAWRDEDGGAWLSAACVAIVASVCASTWLPTGQYDDLAYHLGLPWQLAEHGRYRMDAASQVWALAPWSGDVLHAIAQLLAGREIRGALNLAFVVALLHLVHALARACGLAPRAAWLAVALAASQPMTALLGFSMQTELPSALALVAAALLVHAATPDAPARHVVAVAALFAFALALKVSNVVWVAPLAVWLLARLRRVPFGALVPAAGVALLVGGSSYAYATLLTGNPVLPLFNDVFHSPFFASAPFADARYAGLLAWDTPLAVHTDSSRFFEGDDGVAGFQWLVLLGPLLLAAREPRQRALLLVGLAGVAALFVQVQYLRYLYPGLALLAIPLVGGFGARAAGRGVVALGLTVAFANLAFASNASWQFRNGVVAKAAKPETEWLTRFAPERLVARHLREHGGDAFRVFFPQPDYPPAAELAGRGYVGAWYDPTTQRATAAASADSTGAALRRLALELGATHVLIRRPSASAAVVAMVDGYGTPELVVGAAELYRVTHPALEPFVEPVRDGDDAWTYRYVLARGGPLRVDVDVAFDCAPGTDVRIGWRFRGRHDADERSHVAPCGERGRYSTRLALASVGASHLLALSVARPRETAPPDAVLVRARRDLMAERDAARVLP